IEDLQSTYLPVPYPATRITGLNGDWQWLLAGGTVRSTGATTTEGQSYSVTSLDRRPTADQVRRPRAGGSRALDVYRSLPNRVPEIVRDRADSVAGDEWNDYDRMVALQNWLRNEFTYSVEAPV